MLLTDLLSARLQQTFNLLKKKKSKKHAIFLKHNEAKCNKRRYVCTYHKTVRTATVWELETGHITSETLEGK